MKTYKTKTGYAKNLATGEIFQADTIYLGIYDNPDNYEDATKAECEAYEKQEEAKRSALEEGER